MWAISSISINLTRFSYPKNSIRKGICRDFADFYTMIFEEIQYIKSIILFDFCSAVRSTSSLRYCYIECILYGFVAHKTNDWAHLNSDQVEVMNLFFHQYISIHFFLLIGLYKQLYVSYPAMHPKMALPTSSIHQI